MTKTKMGGVRCRLNPRGYWEATPPFRRCRSCGRYRLRLVIHADCPQGAFYCGNCREFDLRATQLNAHRTSVGNVLRAEEVRRSAELLDQTYPVRARMPGNLEVPK